MSGIASLGRPAAMSVKTVGAETMRAAPLAIGLAAAMLAMPPTGAVGQSADQAPTAIQQAIPVVAQNGMVVTQEPRAARIGVDILQRGGNAVDAAVAVGFALAVSYPRAGNIGGGGFMLIHCAASGDTAIDYRETAPAGINAKSFLDAAGNADPQKSRDSALAIGVPGTVAGLALAETKYGSGQFTLADLMAPAIVMSHDGITLTGDDLADLLPAAQARLTRWPSTARIFLKGDGSALAAGDRLVQGDLADTLQTIARDGPNAFYHGPIAAKIAAAVQAAGGVMTADDLAGYHAVERTPVRGTYRGYDIVSMPPPSSGGVELIEMLNILEGYDLARDDEAQTLHLMIEAMKRAYADRALFLGDPDTVSVPVVRLISKSYAAAWRAGIDPAHATPAADVHAGGKSDSEGHNTTHFSIVDRFGNAVSNTYTLNFSYDHRAQRRQAVPRHRLAGRQPHHHRGAASDRQRDRPRHGYRGCGLGAARAQSMDARSGFCRAHARACSCGRSTGARRHRRPAAAVYLGRIDSRYASRPCWRCRSAHAWRARGRVLTRPWSKTDARG
jgi:gamma-glutamyltranspeptidase/glutathione hydrolase